MKKLLLMICGLLFFGALADEGKVIAQWDFKAGKTASADGKFEGTLRGTTSLGPNGLVLPAVPVSKAGGLAMANNYPELTPQGPFRMEITFRPEKEITAGKPTIMLWDSKYIVTPKEDDKSKRSHSGFALGLRKSGNKWRAAAFFGYGTSSLSVTSLPFALDPAEFQTLTMDYAPTRVLFSLNGQLISAAQIEAPGPLAPTAFRPVIGDRYGSNYWSFEGEIAALTLRELTIKKLEVKPAGRTGFVRLEPKPALAMHIINNTGKELKNQQLEYRITEVPSLKLSGSTIDLPPGGSMASVMLNSSLKPGQYHLEISMAGETETVEFFVAPERGDIYPVMMWGGGDIRKLRDLGFTQELVYLSRSRPDPKDPERVRRGMETLDKLLAEGMYGMDNSSSHRELAKKYPRVGRDGQPYKRENLDASNPEVPPIMIKIAENASMAYGTHPAWAGAMIHSEVRDGSAPSFNGHFEKEYEKFSGAKIPAGVNASWPLGYDMIPDFPVNQILPDNDPLLNYYRWYWRTGDGWNPLHSAVSKALHSHVDHPFWTYHDPAVRVPPVWGGGGEVDCISQWSYTNPEPLKVGQTTDEMLAMAAGRPGQMVMKMTQTFWYRNQSAPPNQKVANPPEWLAREKAAKYISISPDHLRIAFWSMISRKLDGIMYHGYSSLVEPKDHGYRYTCPETAGALKELTSRVIVPLGPVLKRIPERQPQVAILESFPSAIYARRHSTQGWGRNWWSELHLALQWAHYQPAVIYDDHIAKGILSQVKVLFLPGAEVLTESTVKAIQDFQRGGGLVVGDNFLLPAILPDISIEAVQRKTTDPAGTRKQLQTLGALIREQLEPYYQAPCNADSPDVVTRLRSWENSDYLFVINDKRTFGDYVGQWGRIQEKGLPLSATVSVNRQSGAVYDLMANKAVKFNADGKKTDIGLQLEPGEGRLLLLLEHPIKQIVLNAPAEAKPGQAFNVDIVISDSTGKPVPALLPVAVTLLDPQGKQAPGSDYFCAENGKLTVPLTVSLNDQPGTWKIIAKSLADSKTATREIKVGP